MKLPPSLDKARHTLAEEVAWAKGLTTEQRLAVLDAVCRSTIYMLAVNAKRDRVLTLRDPVPESTKRAMNRLRAQMPR